MDYVVHLNLKVYYQNMPSVTRAAVHDPFLKSPQFLMTIQVITWEMFSIYIELDLHRIYPQSNPYVRINKKKPMNQVS